MGGESLPLRQGGAGAEGCLWQMMRKICVLYGIATEGVGGFFAG